MLLLLLMAQALRFLDAISGNLDSTAEHQYVEK